MRNFKNVLALAGNSNFCSAEEALLYLKDCYDDSVWISVLTRKDVSPPIALEYSRKRDRDSIWAAVLSRLDIELEIAISIATKIFKSEVWVAVISRPDMNFESALLHAENANHWPVWLKVYSKAEADPAKILESAKKISDNTVWELVVKREEVLQYIDTLQLPFLIELANEVCSWPLWSYIVKRKDCSITLALECALKSVDSDVYKECLKKEGMLDYLSQLDANDAICLARQYSSWNLWCVILARTDVDPKNALILTTEANDGDVFKVVMGRADVIAYLNDLSVFELLCLAEEIGGWSIWNYIKDQERVVMYLNEIKIDKAINILRKLKGNSICSTILKRKDFKINQILLLIREVPNLSNFWNIIHTKKDFIDYFDSLSNDEALNVAQSFNCEYMFRRFVGRNSLSPKNAIDYANLIQDQEVWNIVLAKPDVIAYLGIKKE